MTPAERTLLLLLAHERLQALDHQDSGRSPEYYDILIAKQTVEEEQANQGV